MASGRAALGSAREPEEWVKATEAARETRSVVAGQIADLLVAADITGGRELAMRRLVELAAAERTGDESVLRAAQMECAVAFGAWIVRGDLQQDDPVAVARRRPRQPVAA